MLPVGGQHIAAANLLGLGVDPAAEFEVGRLRGRGFVRRCGQNRAQDAQLGESAARFEQSRLENQATVARLQEKVEETTNGLENAEHNLARAQEIIGELNGAKLRAEASLREMTGSRAWRAS